MYDTFYLLVDDTCWSYNLPIVNSVSVHIHRYLSTKLALLLECVVGNGVGRSHGSSGF